MSSCSASHSSGPAPLTHYVIVRSDLPLGFLAAQVVHAAGESSPGKLPEGTFAVVLEVDSEAQLIALRARLTLASVEHVIITEPDPPWYGAATAIGIAPVADRATLRAILGGLPLLGTRARGAARERDARAM